MTAGSLLRGADVYRPSADDPYPAFAALRGRAPVAPWDEDGAWAVTGFSAARQVLRSEDFGKAPPDHDGAGEDDGGAEDVPISVLKHVLRKERVHRLEDDLAQLADALVLDCAERQEFDIMHHLAYPLTVSAICSLLGVPAQDQAMVMPWAGRLAPLFDNREPPEEGALKADLRCFQSYFSGLAAERVVTPGDDAISDLLAQGVKGSALLQAALFLFLAGQETTMNLIGNGVNALLQHPAQLIRLRSDPQLIPVAVEEFLRFDSPLQRNARVAQVDTELDGVRIAAGDVTFILVGAANRDPLQFDRPDEFNISRQPNQHLTFGYGQYFCYGAMLARLEARLAISALLRHIPWLEQAQTESRWREMCNFRGLERLVLQP